MGFPPKKVWVMGYCGLMGYGVKFSAHQLGGLKKVWDMRVYGLSQAWVMRGSTVVNFRVFVRPLEYCTDTTDSSRHVTCDRSKG
jgi:hypothetical protein